MPTILTCGKMKPFTYAGDPASGIIIKYSNSRIEISPRFLRAAIDHFKGREVKGGFSMTDPPSGGFGDWVKRHSKTLNKTPLSPRHGSHIAAILREMGYLRCGIDGGAVILTFKEDYGSSEKPNGQMPAKGSVKSPRACELANLETAEQAKRQNITDMALTFTAMMRLFSKGSKESITEKFEEFCANLKNIGSVSSYEKSHENFCKWFSENVQTAC